jgi:hypothetical protein
MRDRIQTLQTEELISCVAPRNADSLSAAEHRTGRATKPFTSAEFSAPAASDQKWLQSTEFNQFRHKETQFLSGMTLQLRQPLCLFLSRKENGTNAEYDGDKPSGKYPLGGDTKKQRINNFTYAKSNQDYSQNKHYSSPFLQNSGAYSFISYLSIVNARDLGRHPPFLTTAILFFGR